MSKSRDALRVLKNPIREVLIRVAQMGRRLAKLGRNPAHAARTLRERRFTDHKAQRRHWRRWWRANRKHQRRFGALKGHPGRSRIPHSLSLWMVP